MANERIVKLITWLAGGVTLLAVLAFVLLGWAIFGHSDGEPTVIEISVPVVQTEAGNVPEVEGVLPPSILVDYRQCVDAATGLDENCTTVPISFERTNLTTETIEVEARGIWTSFVVDDDLNVIGDEEFTCILDRSQTFSMLPGVTAARLNAHPDTCVLDRISDLASDNVYLSVWQLTSVIDPITEGKTATATSQNFTLVHPDWPGFEPGGSDGRP